MRAASIQSNRWFRHCAEKLFRVLGLWGVPELRAMKNDPALQGAAWRRLDNALEFLQNGRHRVYARIYWLWPGEDTASAQGEHARARTIARHNLAIRSMARALDDTTAHIEGGLDDAANPDDALRLMRGALRIVTDKTLEKRAREIIGILENSYDPATHHPQARVG